MDPQWEDDALRLQAALAGLVGLRLAQAFRWHEVDMFNLGPVRGIPPAGRHD
jgi:hypothetical protein